MTTKKECEKEAQDNRNLAALAEQQGNYRMAGEAHERARDWERASESWLYRWFGL